LGDVKEMLKHRKVLYDGLGLFETEEVSSGGKGNRGTKRYSVTPNGPAWAHRSE
jgi:hypothetical protein